MSSAVQVGYDRVNLMTVLRSILVEMLRTQAHVVMQEQCIGISELYSRRQLTWDLSSVDH